MADRPYPKSPVHQLRTSVQSARNLTTTLPLSIGSDAVAYLANEAIDVQGIPYLRVYNATGGAAVASAVLAGASFPMSDQAGVALSVAAGVTQLVDVRGAENVSFGAAVTISLVVG